MDEFESLLAVDLSIDQNIFFLCNRNISENKYIGEKSRKKEIHDLSNHFWWFDSIFYPFKLFLYQNLTMFTYLSNLHSIPLTHFFEATQIFENLSHLASNSPASNRKCWASNGKFCLFSLHLTWSKIKQPWASIPKNSNIIAFLRLILDI